MAILLAFSCCAQAQNKVILSAMKDELKRSMEQLKLENEAGPYYISYHLNDTYSLRIAADSGCITANSESRGRTLNMSLRVGSYAQDNSNFTSVSGLSNTASLLSGLVGVAAPLDDDYAVLRREIWQATDRIYKSALENLTQKKAALQNTVQSADLPDFSKSEAVSNLAAENSFSVQKQTWSQLVDQLSKLFLGEPKIQKSRIDFTVLIANSYHVNSEGSVWIEPTSTTQLSIAAGTQADDGMPLNNYRIYTATRPEGLPGRASLESDIKSLISELITARSAPVATEYSGPVLFSAQAAGELFSQGFGNLMAAKRLPVLDNPQMNSMVLRSENPFQSKIGMKVAAGFLSLKAAPTLKSYNQKALLGSYRIDEEGVFARDVSLVENGILKDLLTSRTPVKGFPESNGHARGGAAAPSVIQVISTQKKAYEQLKQELVQAAKEEGFEFGYLVRGITPPSASLGDDSAAAESILGSAMGGSQQSQFRLTRPFLIFRVYPDGREEMVRGLDFGAISVNALKNVLATSQDEIIYDYPVGIGNVLSGLGGIISMLGSLGSGGLSDYATVITPSVLISGIDLVKSRGTYPKLPIVPYPTK